MPTTATKHTTCQARPLRMACEISSLLISVYGENANRSFDMLRVPIRDEVTILSCTGEKEVTIFLSGGDRGPGPRKATTFRTVWPAGRRDRGKEQLNLAIARRAPVAQLDRARAF